MEIQIIACRSYLAAYTDRKCEIDFGAMAAAGINSAANITSTAMTNKANKDIAADTNAANERMTGQTNQTNLAINEATNAANERMAHEANETNIALAREANDLNYRMFTEQNDFNYNMWQEQLEYDSPAAQRQRLIEAGYNPIMLGTNSDNATGNSGQSSAPVSAQWTGAQTAHVNPAQFSPIKLDAAHFDRAVMQAPNVDFIDGLARAAGAMLTKAQQDKVKSETSGLQLANDFSAATFDTRKEMETKQLQIAAATLKDLLGQGEFNTWSRNQQKEAWCIYKRTMELTNDDIEATIAKRKADTAYIQQVSQQDKDRFKRELRKIDAEVRNLDSQTALAYANQQLAKAQTGLTEEQKSLVSAQTKQIEDMTPQQIEQIKHSMWRDRVSAALSLLNVPKKDRGALAEALMENPDADAFVSGLEQVNYSGDFNNWWSAAQRFFSITDWDSFTQGPNPNPRSSVRPNRGAVRTNKGRVDAVSY